MKRFRFTLGYVSVVALLAGGCVATGPQQCRRDPVTGSEQCQSSSGDYGEAAATAGAATASWAVVGCKLNGCPPPDRCNQNTKLCEAVKCTTQSDCPVAFHCDVEANRCR